MESIYDDIDDNQNEKIDSKSSEEQQKENDSDSKEKKDDSSLKKNEEVEKKEVRAAMHKTTSIFLRNLSPTITKAEVEAVRI